jgi:lipoprotein-releasing system permease protein
MNEGWLPFEWIAAVRFLREGRMQTLFIVCGVAIGVAVIVFMSAMLQGLQANFINRVLTSQPHIQLIPPNQLARPQWIGEGVFENASVQFPTQRLLPIVEWQKIRDRMVALPEVLEVSPTMTGSVLAVRGDASHAVNLAGVDPSTYFRIVHMDQFVVAGNDTLTTETIILGVVLAQDLGATVGDKLKLVAASGVSTTLRISGLVDFGNKAVNTRNAYVALRTSQSLLGLQGGANTIDITVRDIYAAETLAKAIQASNYVEADSWIATNAQFFTAVQAQQTSSIVIMGFVGLSVAFGIAAVLVVSVIQRSQDIGILRAMGTTRGQIQRLFLLQGALLGLVGSLVGAALGAAALAYFHAMSRQANGAELFPLILERRTFIVTAIAATVTGVLAAMAPASRAAKLDPVEAIRG